MSRFEVKLSREIPAPAANIYTIIADYKNGHPRILPAPYFLSLDVEEGGIGAGTIIRFEMDVMGKTQSFRAEISEPEPGRTLVETDLETGAPTTFTVDALDAEKSRVTITTLLKTRKGMLGKIEGWFTKRFLEPIYAEELQQLEEIVTPK
jgi:uncharacterized protein YndB with AHSA1/START domain